MKPYRTSVAGRDYVLHLLDGERTLRRKYVVIYDGLRQRICHVGFLREDTAGEIDRCVRQLRW